MKKSKGQTIDLLYSIDESKKKPKKKQKKIKKQNEQETIDLSNEIIIGLTPKKEEKKQIKNITKKKNNKSNTKIKRKVEKNVKKVKNNQPKKKKKNKKIQIIKWTSLIIILAIGIIFFLKSSIFNIKEIIVLNNSQISTEEIIKLSTLEKDTNMFDKAKIIIKNNIKVNPYIENVKIKRTLTGKITLDITERETTYMLKFANAYVYINNQGYMLEISENPLENISIITGFATPIEEIKEGNRLIVEDLIKLEDVIKIMESAKSNSLKQKITQIDISQNNNYMLTLEEEQKTVRFGSCTNVSVKMLKIEALLEAEKGNKGEIYFQDSEKTVFKEETNY